MAFAKSSDVLFRSLILCEKMLSSSLNMVIVSPFFNFHFNRHPGHVRFLSRASPRIPRRGLASADSTAPHRQIAAVRHASAALPVHAHTGRQPHIPSHTTNRDMNDNRTERDSYQPTLGKPVFPETSEVTSPQFPPHQPFIPQRTKNSCKFGVLLPRHTGETPFTAKKCRTSCAHSLPRRLHQGFSASISGKVDIHETVRYSHPRRPKSNASRRDPHVRAFAAPFCEGRRTVSRRGLSLA